MRDLVRAVGIIAITIVSLWASSTLTGCTGKSTSNHKNVLLIVLDTLRADHLGVYGYERDTSPNLDAFARENILFKNAITTSPWTPPSLATFFTGLYPVAHGVMPPNGREEAAAVFHKLSSDLTTAAEFFKQKGYQTSGITPNPWITKTFGYDQGFDSYKEFIRAPAGKITEEAFGELERLSKEAKPFFFYLHYLDPHDPYSPPDRFKLYNAQKSSYPYDERTQELVNLYDGEIRYMDATLGQLFEKLRALNLYEDMVIVIVGDHGEQFKERGDQGHGFRLHQEEVHVPLMVRSGEPHRVVDFTVSTVDVFPTMLELAGFEIPTGIQGVSLKNDENSRERMGVLSEILRKYNQKSITTFEGEKLIIDFGALENKEGSLATMVGAGLFDRTIDPGERAAIENTEKVKELLKVFEELYTMASGSSPAKAKEETTVSDETVKQLKSLGYLQ
jgi:arylsulfatase A-like enzyme